MKQAWNALVAFGTATAQRYFWRHDFYHGAIAPHDAKELETHRAAFH